MRKVEMKILLKIILEYCYEGENDIFVLYRTYKDIRIRGVTKEIAMKKKKIKWWKFFFHKYKVKNRIENKSTE